MKIIIIFGLLVCASAKPTFDVIEDIIHDLHNIVHDPHQPSNHGPSSYPQNAHYAHSGRYVENSYSRPPTYTPNGYLRPYPQTNGYPPNTHHSGYYPSSANTGGGGYGHNGVYNNQGYYQGPPYPNNGYENNGYSHPSQYGYKNRGY